MIDVAVAVEDPVTAIGLQAIIDGSEEARCVHLTHDAETIRDVVARLGPRVLILDVAFRKADPELLPDLSGLHAETAVIVYVDHSAEECGLRHFLAADGRAGLSPEALARLDDCCLTSLKMNARGCVGTGARPEMILGAIRTVVAGEVAAAPWLASMANVFQGGGGLGDSGGLSEREIEIMGLLARGMSNKQIGKHLGIREQTVKNHVTRTMAKLGVESRLEVGVLAARHNLRLADPEG